MGILRGNLSVRRLRVIGETPPGFRDQWMESLSRYAFADPPGGVGGEEVEGWVNARDLLDTDFSDLNRWLFGEYALFALRVDKKTLPANLFAATLARRVEQYCADRGLERCPPTVKSDLKEELADEWYRQQLPRVTITEACWNLHEGYLLLHSHSDRTLERFRKRFSRTFDLRLVPWSPLDWLDEATGEELLSLAPARLDGGGDEDYALDDDSHLEEGE